jgi:hypothetical protein
MVESTEAIGGAIAEIKRLFYADKLFEAHSFLKNASQFYKDAPEMQEFLNSDEVWSINSDIASL